MDKKEYSFTYIQYKISNLMLIPLCFFVWILADCFERIDHIKNANSGLYFESGLDGTFLTLERKELS